MLKMLKKSKQHDTGKESTNRSMEQNRQCRKNTHKKSDGSLTKDQRQFNGERIACSRNAAGVTGYPFAKRISKNPISDFTPFTRTNSTWITDWNGI